MSEQTVQADKKENESKRFSATRIQRVVLPAVFVLLALGILLTIIIIGLSLLGLTPGV